MKKLILFIALCLFWIPFVYGSRVIENPVFKTRTGSILTIRKIELTDQATRLHVQVVFRPGWWISIASATYIADCTTGQHYLPVAAEGMAFGERIYLPESGTLDIVLVYPALPASTHTIDWVDPTYPEWRIYGISLMEPGKIKKKIPGSIGGNWITQDGRDEWVAGLYDSLAVYRERFWKYAAVKKKGKRYLVDLVGVENAAETCRLVLQPAGDGRCRIEADGLTFDCGRKRDPSVKAASEAEDFSDFYRTDTAYIQGYLKGYDPVLGFTSGIIYISNDITNETSPTVVKIHPDGRFEAKLLLDYPAAFFVNIQNYLLPAYLEPGRKLTMFVDNEALLDYRRGRDRDAPIRDVVYMGRPAAMCRHLEKMRNLFGLYDADWQKYQKLLTPAQYKEKKSAELARWLAAADSIIAADRLPAKAARLFRNTARIKYATALFNFVDSRSWLASQDTSNQVLKIKEDDSYYDFLRQLPLDDETLPACIDFSTFINRFEFMDLFNSPDRVYFNSLEESLQLTLKEDSLKREKLTGFLGASSVPFAWQVAIVRGLNFDLDRLKEKKLVRQYLEESKKHLSFPVLLSAADKIYDRLYSDAGASYELPEAEPGTAILRKITDRYRGKYVLIDFWSTTCGPCRGQIERTAKLRAKYRDSDDIRLIFITSEDESPENDYKKYVEKNLAESDCYRLPADDYRYLQQLFHIYGIPHSETLNREGRVLRKGITYESFYYEWDQVLQRERLLQSEKR